jgi:hypothetical protein
MNWIFDQPLILVLLSVAILTGLAITWITSGQKLLLYALIAGVAIAVILLVVERFVVTDREAIDATLQQMARDVGSNIPAKVTQHISASAPSLQARANTEMPKYKFESLRITKVHKIDVNATAEPRTAVVEFNIMAKGTFGAGADVLADATIPRWVQLDLVKDPDGEWRVSNYDHDAPQRMMFEDLIPEELKQP